MLLQELFNRGEAVAFTQEVEGFYLHCHRQKCALLCISSYPDCAETNIVYLFTCVLPGTPLYRHNPISSSVLYHLDDLQFIALQCKLLWHDRTQFCVFVWVFFCTSSSANWTQFFSYSVGPYPFFLSTRLKISIRVSQWVPFGFLMRPLRIMDMPIGLALRYKQQTAYRGRSIKIYRLDDNPPHPHHQNLSHTHTHLPPSTTPYSGADWLAEKSAISKELWGASQQQINGPLFIVFGHQVHSRAKLLKRHKQNQTKPMRLCCFI